MTRCPEECKKQWKPKQGKLGWEKQREEEAEEEKEEKKKERKREQKKQKKEKTIKINQVAEE